MFFWTEAHQKAAQQRALLQVKRFLTFLRDDALRLGIALRPRKIRDIKEGYFRLLRGQNDLSSLSLDRLEYSSQRSVAPHDDVQGTGEDPSVERALYQEGARKVIGGCPGFKLIQEPESLLAKGSRKAGIHRGGMAQPPSCWRRWRVPIQ